MDMMIHLKKDPDMKTSSKKDMQKIPPEVLSGVSGGGEKAVGTCEWCEAGTKYLYTQPGRDYYVLYCSGCGLWNCGKISDYYPDWEAWLAENG